MDRMKISSLSSTSVIKSSSRNSARKYLVSHQNVILYYTFSEAGKANLWDIASEVHKYTQWWGIQCLLGRN